MLNVPTVVPRRALDNNTPDGYRESDKDFVLNNLDVCVQLLEQIQSVQEALDGGQTEEELLRDALVDSGMAVEIDE